MTLKPLREPSILILASLGEGPLHGYAIAKSVEESSDNRVKLGPGTLYGALDRLDAEGLIEIASEERSGKRVKRFYRLTAAGGHRLQDEVDRISQVAKTAESALKAWRQSPATFSPVTQ